MASVAETEQTEEALAPAASVLGATVDREPFLCALKRASTVTGRKSSIPILRVVLLEADDGLLRISATDLNQYLAQTIPAEVLVAGSVAIPVGRLTGYLSRSDAETVSLAAEEWKLRVWFGEQQLAEFCSMAVASFPRMEAHPTPRISVSAAVLRGAIERIIFAISSEESRYTLNGALLLIKDGALTMVATDGYRMSWSQQAIGSGDIQMRRMLGTATLQTLLILMEDCGDATVGIGFEEERVSFTMGRMILNAKEATGNFPDYGRVMPSSYPDEFPIPHGLASAIERVATFADECSRRLDLSIGHGELRVSSTLSETGSASETLAIDYEASKVEIALNYRYLLDALNGLHGSSGVFRFSNGVSVSEVTNGSGYRSLVMPMRV